MGLTIPIGQGVALNPKSNFVRDVCPDKPTCFQLVENVVGDNLLSTWTIEDLYEATEENGKICGTNFLEKVGTGSTGVQFDTQPNAGLNIFDFAFQAINDFTATETKTHKFYWKTWQDNLLDGNIPGTTDEGYAVVPYINGVAYLTEVFTYFEADPSLNNELISVPLNAGDVVNWKIHIDRVFKPNTNSWFAAVFASNITIDVFWGSRIYQELTLEVDKKYKFSWKHTLSGRFDVNVFETVSSNQIKTESYTNEYGEESLFFVATSTNITIEIKPNIDIEYLLANNQNTETSLCIYETLLECVCSLDKIDIFDCKGNNIDLVGIGFEETNGLLLDSVIPLLPDQSIELDINLKWTPLINGVIIGNESPTPNRSFWQISIFDNKIIYVNSDGLGKFIFWEIEVQEWTNDKEGVYNLKLRIDQGDFSSLVGATAGAYNVAVDDRPFSPAFAANHVTYMGRTLGIGDPAIEIYNLRIAWINGPLDNPFTGELILPINEGTGTTTTSSTTPTVTGTLEPGSAWVTRPLINAVDINDYQKQICIDWAVIENGKYYLKLTDTCDNSYCTNLFNTIGEKSNDHLLIEYSSAKDLCVGNDVLIQEGYEHSLLIKGILQKPKLNKNENIIESSNAKLKNTRSKQRIIWELQLTEYYPVEILTALSTALMFPEFKIDGELYQIAEEQDFEPEWNDNTNEAPILIFLHKVGEDFLLKNC